MGLAFAGQVFLSRNDGKHRSHVLTKRKGKDIMLHNFILRKGYEGERTGKVVRDLASSTVSADRLEPEAVTLLSLPVETAVREVGGRRR